MTHSGSIVLAIDYGTSNSLVAAAADGKIFGPIALDQSAKDPNILRSVVFTAESNQWFFGAAAIDEYTKRSAEGRLFRSIKKYLPDVSFVGTNVHKRYYNLSELVAVFLRHLREKAIEHFGQDIESAVIGRPALFSENPEADQLAEKRLEAAAHLAGFKQVSFLAEPVAAAFEFRHQLTCEQNVLVADFGGGTSDFTVLRLSKEELKKQDILSIGGISVAGDMFDGSIMRHMVAPYFGTEVVYRMPMGSNDLRLPKNLVNRMCSPADMSFLARQDILILLRDAQKWSINPEDAKKMNRLFVLIEEHLGYSVFRSIEQAKIELSQSPSTTFSFNQLDIDITEEIASADFRFHSQNIVDKIIATMDETVKNSGLSYDQIDVVCSTGGTAKIPALRHALEKRLGQEKLKEHRHFDSVVAGLAEKAAELSRS